MPMRIQKWAASGVGGDAGSGGKDKDGVTGKKELERLWESVERREGVVVEIVGPGPGPSNVKEKMDVDEPHPGNLVNRMESLPTPNSHLPSSTSTNATPAPAPSSQPTKSQSKWSPKAKWDRELARLHPPLDKILLQREQLTKRIVQRSEAPGFDECGWDQRMCLDEEVKEYGAGVLESYEEGPRDGDEGATGNGTGTPREGREGRRGVSFMGVVVSREEKCDRHAGYVSFSFPFSLHFLRRYRMLYVQPFGEVFKVRRELTLVLSSLGPGFSSVACRSDDIRGVIAQTRNVSFFVVEIGV